MSQEGHKLFNIKYKRILELQIGWKNHSSAQRKTKNMESIAPDNIEEVTDVEAKEVHYVITEVTSDKYVADVTVVVVFVIESVERDKNQSKYGKEFTGAMTQDSMRTALVTPPHPNAINVGGNQPIL